MATAGSDKSAAYLTPDQASDLFDDPESLVVVRFNSSGADPRLASNERGPVEVTTYRSELVEQVVHCEYEAARGTDHGVTHRLEKGQLL